MELIGETLHTRIYVTDQADSKAGGENHAYVITDIQGNLLQTISFQHGPIGEHGVNGIQHADLLVVVQHRLDSFQKGSFNSTVNEVTCGFVAAALASEATRSRRRTLAGVEGTNRKALGVEAAA